MRKVRNALPIVLTTLAILGLLAVAGYAGKPAPSMPTWVKVTGAITGEGDPDWIRVTFDRSIDFPRPDSSHTLGQVFISNPDSPPPLPENAPSLWVTGAGANLKQLHYFFCAHESHYQDGSTDLRCEAGEAHYDYYYCLLIFRGRTQKSGAVVFPKDSNWEIRRKKDPQMTVARGTLDMPVTYEAIWQGNLRSGESCDTTNSRPGVGMDVRPKAATFFGRRGRRWVFGL